MAWPNPPLLDDFNRANETPLAGNWTKHPSYFDLDLNANAVRLTSTTGPCMDYWSATTFGPSCAASFEFAGWYTGGGTGGQFFIGLCAGGALLANAYFLTFTLLATGAPGSMNVQRAGASSWFQAGSLGGFPAIVALTDQLGFYVNGRSLEVWFKTAAGSWGLIQSFDDAALSGTTALPAGYAIIGGNEPGGLLQAQAVRMDNFHVGNPAGAGRFWVSLV